MELNSLLILLEAAEYLERRDRGSARAPLCAGPRAGGRAAAGPGPGRDPLTAPHRLSAEAEHGYASVLPFDGDFARKKTKAAGLVRKAPNNRYRPPPGRPRPARGSFPQSAVPRSRSPACSPAAAMRPGGQPGGGGAPGPRPQPRPAGPARAVAIFLRAAPPRPLA